MAVSTPATPFRTTCALDKHGTRRVQHILDQCRSWVGDLRDILRLDSHLYLAFRYVWSRSVREPVEAAAMSHWPRVRGGPTGLAAKHTRDLSLCPSVFSGVSGSTLVLPCNAVTRISTTGDTFSLTSIIRREPTALTSSGAWPSCTPALSNLCTHSWQAFAHERPQHLLDHYQSTAPTTSRDARHPRLRPRLRPRAPAPAAYTRDDAPHGPRQAAAASCDANA